MNLVAVFSVDGVMGMPRARTSVFKGKVIHYTPKEARGRKRVIAATYRKSTSITAALDGPVRVEVVTQRAIPKSRPKKVTVEPDIYRPDADNILKLVLDALNKVAWTDDTRVVETLVRKLPRRRDVRECTTVYIYTLEEAAGA